MITKSIMSPYEVMCQFSNRKFYRSLDNSFREWDRFLYLQFNESYRLIAPITLVGWDEE